MVVAIADLVKQTSTDTGTGVLTLIAPTAGFQSFNGAFGNGATLNVFYYYISNTALTEWEVGSGHMNSSTSLTRDTVILSSNANAAVNFSAGNKNVVCDVPASLQTLLITSTNANTPNTLVNRDASGNFSAGTITAILNGLASTATALATPRAINGVNFDGTANITIPLIASVKKQIFTSSGTYTPSTGMIYCIVQGCGGGGQGGCCASLTTSIGGGGGGGAFGVSLITAATIGASKSVTIGIGGSTSIAGANNGQAGGQTSLGTLAIFPGGGGGPNLSGVVGVGGAGGASPTCDMGSSGYNGGAIVIAGSISGIGANGPFGRGGAEVVNGIGNSGAGFGSGGGGAKGSGAGASVGGSGTPGIIYITEFCNQ